MLNITPVKLSYGAHPSPEEGLCLMEMVAFLNGEPHSDHPHCVCPTLIRYGITLNDYLSDVVRQKELLPLVHKLIGTRCDEMMKARAELLLNRTFNDMVLPVLRRVDRDCPTGKLTRSYFSELYARPQLFGHGTLLMALIATGDFVEPEGMARKASETLARMIYDGSYERRQAIPIAIDIFRECIEMGPHSALDEVKVSEKNEELVKLFA